MEKIKITELLNRVHNGNAPSKILYGKLKYHISYEYGDYESDIEEYRTSDYKEHYYLFQEINLLEQLNDEVEIIEEDKKIEKIETKVGYGGLTYLKDDERNTLGFTHRESIIVDKINEIIDVINKEKE